jgi:hypothetical protein
VLVDEAGGVVDLVVDDHVEVLLGGVLGDIGVGEGLGCRHDCGVVCVCVCVRVCGFVLCEGRSRDGE